LADMKITRRAAVLLTTAIMAGGCNGDDNSSGSIQQMTPDQLLNELERLLLASIPKHVGNLRIREPMYCLRLWYYGSDTPAEFLTFRLTLKSSALRSRLVSEKGAEAPHYLWCADEVERGEGVINSDLTDPQIVKYYRRWMKIAFSVAGRPGSSRLAPLREMAQRVATALNKIDWAPACAVTDDFVVFPADGSHTFLADFDELTSCVSTDRIELLRNRKYLGTREWYHH
jgi:hypothetical protein